METSSTRMPMVSFGRWGNPSHRVPEIPLLLFTRKAWLLLQWGRRVEVSLGRWGNPSRQMGTISTRMPKVSLGRRGDPSHRVPEIPWLLFAGKVELLLQWGGREVVSLGRWGNPSHQMDTISTRMPMVSFGRWGNTSHRAPGILWLLFIGTVWFLLQWWGRVVVSLGRWSNPSHQMVIISTRMQMGSLGRWGSPSHRVPELVLLLFIGNVWLLLQWLGSVVVSFGRLCNPSHQVVIMSTNMAVVSFGKVGKPSHHVGNSSTTYTCLLFQWGGVIRAASGMLSMTNPSGAHFFFELNILLVVAWKCKTWLWGPWMFPRTNRCRRTTYSQSGSVRGSGLYNVNQWSNTSWAAMWAYEHDARGSFVSFARVCVGGSRRMDERERMACFPTPSGSRLQEHQVLSKICGFHAACVCPSCLRISEWSVVALQTNYLIVFDYELRQQQPYILRMCVI